MKNNEYKLDDAKPRIILAHPGQQHSYKVASALKKEGMLYRYITAVYRKNGNIPMKLTRQLIKGKDIQKFNARINPDLEDDEVLTCYTLLSLAVIFFSRYRVTSAFSYWLNRRISYSFGIKVAKYAIRKNVDAVVCFAPNEVSCFEYLKKYAPNIKRIVDCAAPAVNYMKFIYEGDKGYRYLKTEVPYYWDKNRLRRELAGITKTEFFLAPSEFVKKGLMYCGAEKSAIRILNYGTNFQPLEKPQNIPKRVRFIFVGRVVYEKGCHYLLKAFSELEKEHIELDLVGDFDKDSNLYKQFRSCHNIHFIGRVSHDEIKSVLLASNVMVFPSLAEGMSLACLEALSCGLPLICSCDSGVNDIIKDGVNGYVISHDNTELLKEKVQFFYNHPEIIPEFSRNALKTAAAMTWEEYQHNLADILMEIMNSKNEQTG